MLPEAKRERKKHPDFTPPSNPPVFPQRLPLPKPAWKVGSPGKSVLSDAEELEGRKKHRPRSKGASDQHNNQHLPENPPSRLPHLVVYVSTYQPGKAKTLVFIIYSNFPLHLICY